MARKKKNPVRRVTIYRDNAGEFRYFVQANNWKRIQVAEEGFKRKSTVLKRVEANWPHVEVIDQT